MSYIGKQPIRTALTSSDIEDGVITAAKIEDGAVVAAEIASNAVTTAKINADAVTGAKIADDAINSEHYTDGSVDTAHIADSNITQAKIADQAINEAKMQISNAPTNGYFLSAQSGNTGGLTWATAGGDNTPAFHVYTDGTQQVSNNTETTVVFDQEIVDTDNAFASNQFTVPSGEGGKYYIYFMLTYSSGDDFSYQHTLKIDNSYDADSGFRANGFNWYYDAGHYGRIINLSAGNVLKVVTYQSSGSNQPVSASENRATFGGYKLIGV